MTTDHSLSTVRDQTSITLPTKKKTRKKYRTHNMVQIPEYGPEHCPDLNHKTIAKAGASSSHLVRYSAVMECIIHRFSQVQY
jgi:hypothetical protein